MSILTPPTLVTPEDLLSLPDGDSYELVDGKLVERHMGLESSKIALRIAFLIARFLQDTKLGELFGSDASYQCFPQYPGEVRRADLTFIRQGRFEGGRLPKGHCKIPPDLAVEVISPGDLAYDVEEKVSMYLKAGVRSVWVVYPPTQVVRVHRRGAVTELTTDDTIAEPELLPDFECKVAEFFI